MENRYHQTLVNEITDKLLHNIFLWFICRIGIIR